MLLVIYSGSRWQRDSENELLEQMTPVVRGGTLRDPEKVVELVLDNLDMGYAALSVFWSPPIDESETESEYLIRLCSESRIPHKQIQISTPAQLAEAGFALVADNSGGQAPNHHHVMFNVPVTLDQAMQFVAVFTDPRPNPTGGYRMRS